MRKTIKKLTAVGLTLTSVMGLVACGNNNASNGTKETVDWASVEKPGHFTIMVDGTVPTLEEWGEKFDEQLKSLTGLDFEVTRPDHNSYYDAVANSMLDASAMPDVIILSSDYLALYASQGLLWDMTDAWNNSATKSSGRLISDAEKIMKANYVRGVDGEKSLYGFVPARGNGCVTYVKEAWATQAGYSKADLTSKQLSYDEFYTMLKKMKEARGVDYVISAPGFYSKEAPYTNYLPEFYQNANFTFYYDEAAKEYKDGFAQQDMKDALTRLKTAVDDGILDKASQNQTTSDARNKWNAKDASTASSVFTYWAGTWANTLMTNLKSKGLPTDLIAINPIKELGTYVERIAPAWCITTSAKNPEGIFKYFIDTMLDGGDIQTAWEYGAKGTHWNDKAETVTLADGKGTFEYKEGEFHFLPSPEKPSTLMSKNHIDPILALAKFKTSDPGEAKMTEAAKKNGEFFAKNSTVATPLPMTETLGENSTDINTTRNKVISEVALGNMTVEEGMKLYKDRVGTAVEAVLKSLNETKKSK